MPLAPPTYNDLRFVCAAPHSGALPPPCGPEIAFAGRSNAGKSTAMNAICGRAGLARTSKTPGHTRAINFFASPSIAFADLPGYGYARVPAAVKARWQALLEGYLSTRANLAGVVLVIDARRSVTGFDRQLLAWGARYALVFHILLTKADKLARNRQHAVLAEVKQTLSGAGVQLFSAPKRWGIDDARRAIADLAARPAFART